MKEMFLVDLEALRIVDIRVARLALDGTTVWYWSSEGKWTSCQRRLCFPERDLAEIRLNRALDATGAY